MDELRIWLLGGFRAAVNGQELPEAAWRLRKARAIVKVLALTPGRRIHRERLAEALWPGLPVAAAANQLRKALHEVRQVLGADRVGSVGDQLSLHADFVDVSAFETAVLAARRSGEPEAYQAAVDLYGGDLLPEDRYEEWAEPHTDRLRREAHELLVEWAALLEARADVDAAIAALRRVLADEPSHEEAGAALMRLQALAGRRSAAMAEYDALRLALDRDLGVTPSAATERLYAQIRAGRMTPPELTADLWHQVGDLRSVAGDLLGARLAYESALGSAAAPDRARLHRKAASALVMCHDPAAAERHLRAAGAQPADAAERARLLDVRANWLCELGRLDDALATAEDALAAATEHGTTQDLATVNETLAIVHHFRGDWREGMHSELHRLELDDDQAFARIFDLHHCIGQYHLYGDDLSAGVEDYALRTLNAATQRGALRAQAFAWCLLGESLLLHGRWDEAEGCLERSAEIHGELGPNSGALPWQRLAELAAVRGDSESAAAALRRGMAIAGVSPLARHTWGRLYATAALDAVERGYPEEALRAVRSAAAAAARHGECPSCAALLNPIAAETCAALGDVASADLHAAAAERVAGMFDSSAWRAMAETARASVDAAKGESAAAQEHFAAGVALYGRALMPFWAARTTMQAAQVGPAAAGQLDAAIEVFDRIGAVRRLRNAQGMAAF
ncbi:BTAD domain-containing putative transcriptional regulator [Kribbella catacumbae]|uniref:BTAD domain-containing putative transcriptional regulator n=1 Tax=Kribbella catacumbae TaxID=460086 RepID=UPI000370C963|nr:BTAD domain-containing putative transcriptional regulator [Kribbella catacumbae]